MIAPPVHRFRSVPPDNLAIKVKMLPQQRGEIGYTANPMLDTVSLKD